MSVVTQFPTTNGAETGAGLTNPTNAYADDTSYATGAPGKNTTLATKYGTFGFDATIPAEAAITKVQIIELHKVNVTNSIATCRTYQKVSGVAGSNHDDATEPAGDTIKTYDVTAEKVWTRTMLLDGTLEVVLAAVQGNSSNAVTMSFDYVQVEVTYTVTPSPNISDTITVTDTPTVLLPILPLNKSETTITVTDTPTLLLPELNINVSDPVSVVDSPVMDQVIQINISDSITLTESINLFTDILHAGTSDSISLTESLELNLLDMPNISDSITLTENINLYIELPAFLVRLIGAT